MRTFIACHVRKTAEIGELISEVEAIRGVTPVRTPDLHLTLYFNGDTSNETADHVSAVLKRFNFRKFSISLTGIGFFPSAASPRVAYFTVSGFPHDLHPKLAESLGSDAEGKGFVPHITFARFHGRTDASALIAKYGKFYFGDAVINELCYYKSELRPTGPVYTVISSVQLM
ncbi:MAG: RNA 2',3'-cyclic phosphodiesterase [Thermoplasmataceae archaeon]